MMDIKKINIILLAFIIMFVLGFFASFSMAYDINTPITDFNSFEDYIKYIEGESINTLDKKAEEENVNGSSGWENAKTTFQQQYEWANINDSSDSDKKAYINELESGIEEQKQLLKYNYDEELGRGYESEYHYKWLIERKNETEKSVEENKENEGKSIDERMKEFIEKADGILNEILDLDTSTMTTQQLSETKEEFSNKLNDLSIEAVSIKKMIGITEAQKETVDKKLAEVDKAYKDKIVNVYGDSADGQKDNGNMDFYYSPDKKEASKANSIDDMLDDAKTITNNKSKISSVDIREFSNSMYNIFLSIGIVTAVLVGATLGVKFMLASVEEKADIKKMLIAYVIGCVVVFGSFGIWKLVVTILQGI